MKHPMMRWLWLGVLALGVAGIFAVVLVIGRTPQLAALTFFQQLFHVALVVHVDLSVLLWFLCIGCFGWAMLAEKYSLCQPYWARWGFYCVAASTLLIAASPLDPHWLVLKSNYIPVLYNMPFMLGLGLLAAGLVVILVPLIPRFFVRWEHTTNEESLFLGAAFCTALALLAFACSAQVLPAGLPVEERFNTLFWAGGHILQFAFTLLMMAGWVVLVETITHSPIRRRFVHFTCIVAMVGAMLSLWGFVKYAFDTSDFMLHQTRVMIEIGGAGATLLGLLAIYKLVRIGGVSAANRAYVSALVASLTLFFAGGALGLLIQGENVIVPAHYHGAIVGVTLALMGYAYAMLPRYGYASVAANRLAFWQPILYGVGQIMHIGGLAYSGGYGVLRKTPAGEMPNLAPDVKAALGFMGLGGLLAIIGGLMFVVVMGQAYRARPRVKNPYVTR